ncbi:MAG: exodeoxyribonuclease VII small subunit [Bacillota bacterium]|jgi:exodeoxyribonuclease VII small subunit|nr:exodeoxyribonuclease VII small subunit [Bacillota bacterium]HHU43182.1 exodeoxyribonuclease VII small subunit [Clostridiales bacterium]
MDYEKSVEKLEGIVKKLDNEKISLEESIKLYGEGVKLVKECMEKLSNLKGEFEVLNSQMQNIELEEEDYD